jgi:hypothetical protein
MPNRPTVDALIPFLLATAVLLAIVVVVLAT